MEDPDLIRRYAEKHDDAAFAELVKRHLPLVYHTALRHVGGDSHSAQDVAQVVFSDLARKASKLAHYPFIGGWLYSRARYAGMATQRRRRRRLAREQKAQLMTEILPEPDRTDWEALRPVIDQALNRLGRRDRDAVILRFFEGRTFAQIGASSGLTEDAARMRVDRALEKLRSSLKDNGVLSTAAMLAVALSTQAAAAVPEGLVASVTGGALAAAATPAAGLVALLQFLTTQKLIVGGALLAGLLGIGYSVHEYQVYRATQARIVREQFESDALAARLQALRQQGQHRTAANAALRAQLATLRTAWRHRAQAALASQRNKARAEAAPASSAANRGPVIAWDLCNNPQVRSALSGWLRGTLAAQFGPIFQSLALSPDQIEALLDRMLMRTYNFNGIGLTLRPEDTTPAEVEQSIRDLLGKDKFQQFVAAQQTSFVGTVATALAGALYDTSSPLTVQQAKQLTQTLAQNNLRPAGSGPAFPNTVDWGAVLDQARDFLGPEQLATLENQATVLASRPGPWGAMNTLSPGALGSMPIYPLGFLLSQRPPP